MSVRDNITVSTDDVISEIRFPVNSEPPLLHLLVRVVRPPNANVLSLAYGLADDGHDLHSVADAMRQMAAALDARAADGWLLGSPVG